MLGDEFRKHKSRCITYEGDEACLYDTFKVPNTCTLILSFISSNSDWRQGVRIGDMSRKTDLRLSVNGQTAPGMTLWLDSSPNPTTIDVAAPQEKIYVYNIWDDGNGQTSSQLAGSGMKIEISEDDRKRTFYCNDGHTTPTFNHLIFSLSIII